MSNQLNKPHIIKPKLANINTKNIGKEKLKSSNIITNIETTNTNPIQDNTKEIKEKNEKIIEKEIVKDNNNDKGKTEQKSKLNKLDINAATFLPKTKTSDLLTPQSVKKINSDSLLNEYLNISSKQGNLNYNINNTHSAGKILNFQPSLLGGSGVQGIKTNNIGNYFQFGQPPNTTKAVKYFNYPTNSPGGINPMPLMYPNTGVFNFNKTSNQNNINHTNNGYGKFQPTSPNPNNNTNFSINSNSGNKVQVSNINSETKTGVPKLNLNLIKNINEEATDKNTNNAENAIKNVSLEQKSIETSEKENVKNNTTRNNNSNSKILDKKDINCLNVKANNTKLDSNNKNSTKNSPLVKEEIVENKLVTKSIDKTVTNKADIITNKLVEQKKPMSGLKSLFEAPVLSKPSQYVNKGAVTSRVSNNKPINVTGPGIKSKKSDKQLEFEEKRKYLEAQKQKEISKTLGSVLKTNKIKEEKEKNKDKDIIKYLEKINEKTKIEEGSISKTPINEILEKESEKVKNVEENLSKKLKKVEEEVVVEKKVDKIINKQVEKVEEKIVEKVVKKVEKAVEKEVNEKVVEKEVEKKVIEKQQEVLVTPKFHIENHYFKVQEKQDIDKSKRKYDVDYLQSFKNVIKLNNFKHLNKFK